MNRLLRKRPIVCSYYFPNWHVDSHYEKIHGKNWTEWNVIRHAQPRFDGHCQPLIPLWGYQDESDPIVMSQKIDAACVYGVDCFIFDWYFFANGPCRERALNEGFLKASNCDDLKFAIMWANHDPIAAHPGSLWKPAEQLWSGAITTQTFEKAIDYCIENYFSRPNYLHVDGKLYFSIFAPNLMASTMGGIDVMKRNFDKLRNRISALGLGEIMLDCRVHDLPGLWENDFDKMNAFLREIGFDMTSNYNWMSGPGFPAIDYRVWFERNVKWIRDYCEKLAVPHTPTVCVGYDTSPRTCQSDVFEDASYPFGPVIINNTPERFELALQKMASLGENRSPMINIACWNEWTEGACLEPEARYGYGYLEAVRNVFGKGEII